jgi:hypothetical protein
MSSGELLKGTSIDHLSELLQKSIVSNIENISVLII